MSALSPYNHSEMAHPINPETRSPGGDGGRDTVCWRWLVRDPLSICSSSARALPSLGLLAPPSLFVALQVGGTPAVLKYMLAEGYLNGDCMTVTGKTMAENLAELPVRTQQLQPRTSAAL